MITETEEVASALEEAARFWPEEADRPGRLLLLLVQAGRAHLHEVDTPERVRDQQLRALREASGAFTGAFGADYLGELRADWPA
jgi:hypothetical protein